MPGLLSTIGGVAAALAAVAVLWAVLVGALFACGRRTEAKAAARLIPDLLVLCKRLAGDERVPRRAKVWLAFGLAYLALPIDLVPDFIPLAGQLDDVIVIGLILGIVLGQAGEQLVTELWPGSPESLRLVLRFAGGERRAARRAGLWLFAVGLPLAVFVALAALIDDRTPHIDVHVLRFASEHRSDHLTTAMEALTTFGSAKVITLVALLIAFLLFWAGKRREAALLLAAMALAGGLNPILKHIYERPRPQLFDPVLSAAGLSFPSGHAMASATLALTLAMIAWPTRWRWPVLLVSAVVAFGVGASRVYLGVHFPIDVLAGWMMAFAIVTGLWLRFDPKREETIVFADQVLTNAVVYTVDAARSRAKAVAITAGRIVAVGETEAIAALAGPQTEVVDLGGRLVLPGFIDSHMHASSAVEDLYAVGLDDCLSVADCLTTVARFAGERPELPSIYGVRWNNMIVPPGGLLATDLDGVIPDRPVLLHDDSYHSAWVNTAMLRLAGISAATPDPDNGVIERLPDGTPSGTLREGAIFAALDALPTPSPDLARAGILHFQEAVAGPYGLTTVHDAGLRPVNPALDAFVALQAAGELTTRYCISFWILEDEPLQPQIDWAVAERRRQQGPDVQAEWVKLFPDGVVEGHTAVLKQPYADRPDFCGEPCWQPEALNEASVAAARAGLQLHYHAIGDAALSMALDAIAAAQAVSGPADRGHASRGAGKAGERPLITHLEIVDAADIPRFADLGVVAVPQPNWFRTDSLYRDLLVPILGQRRADEHYPMRSYWEAGIKVASGSDYPVPPAPDPLVGIQRGVLRRAPGDAEDFGPLNPGEAVTVEQMIESYTINGAYAAKLEDETGSIEVGKSADLVVLSENILELPPEEITQAKVELTLFRGRPVYAGGGLAELGPR